MNYEIEFKHACEWLGECLECPHPDNLLMSKEDAEIAIQCCLNELCDSNYKECWKRFLMAKAKRNTNERTRL